MACQIETVTYPSWWSNATTIKVRDGGGTIVFSGNRADVELLPEGVSFPSKLFPWSYVFSVELVS